MNHRWNNDVCTRCGITRKKFTTRLLMAIVNHPPWDVYRYRRHYLYSFDGHTWFKKKICRKPEIPASLPAPG